MPASSTLWFLDGRIYHLRLHKRYLGLHKTGWTAR